MLELLLATTLLKSDLAERIENYLKPVIDAHQLSGTLLVAKGKTVLFRGAYGMANYELRVPNRMDTRFNIASITKPMTLVVALDALFRRKWDAKDKLSQYLPGFPRGDEITIVDLLNHRSGIPHRVTTDGDECLPQTAASMAQLAAKAALQFKPGERSQYSSAGFSVLARALEVIEKKPYDQLLQEEVFGPADMRNSCSAVSTYFIPNQASSYVPIPGGLWPTTPKNYSFLVGAGCVYSTPEDLFHLLRASIEGKLGKIVTANLIKPDGVYWNGLTNGYRAFLQYDPKDEVTVVLCANTLSGSADRLRVDLPKIVRGEEVPDLAAPLPKIVQMSDSDLAPFAGEYRIDPGNEPTTIRIRKGYLLVGDDSALLPLENGEFYSYRDYGYVRSTRGLDGSVRELDWMEDGKVVVTLKHLGQK